MAPWQNVPASTGVRSKVRGSAVRLADIIQRRKDVLTKMAQWLPFEPSTPHPDKERCFFVDIPTFPDGRSEIFESSKRSEPRIGVVQCCATLAVSWVG